MKTKVKCKYCGKLHKESIFGDFCSSTCKSLAIKESPENILRRKITISSMISSIIIIFAFIIFFMPQFNPNYLGFYVLLSVLIGAVTGFILGQIIFISIKPKNNKN